MHAALTRPLFGSPPASLLLVPFGLCTIGAAVFLPVGAKQKADAAAMNPAEDFAVSGTQCQVTAANAAHASFACDLTIRCHSDKGFVY